MNDQLIKFLKLLENELRLVPKVNKQDKFISHVIQDNDILADIVNKVTKELVNNKTEELVIVNHLFEKSQKRLNIAK